MRLVSLQAVNASRGPNEVQATATAMKVIWQRLNLSTKVRPNDIVSLGPSTLRTRWASWRLAVAVAQRRNRETHWFLVLASNGYSMMITANRDVQTWAPKTVLALTQPHTGSWCCRKDN